jgi:hypothetical protein
VLVAAGNFEAPAAAAVFDDHIAVDGGDLVAGERKGVHIRGEDEGFLGEVEGSFAESTEGVEVMRHKAGSRGVGATEEQGGLERLELSVGCAGVGIA